MGSLIPESEALEFESAAQGESHTWRATREFALLGEILGSFEWGALDLLMFDLPPGAERTVQYADFLGPRTSFLLVTIPSEVARGVVARSVAALSKGPNRLLGYVENMSGYYCRDCNAIKPLFVSPDPSGLGDPLPRDRPVRSRACAALRSRDPSRGTARDTRWPGPGARRAATAGQPRHASAHDADGEQESLAMKFLCVPCDSPMKLQTVGPPERGSLSVVYSCPECGYEMAMLTNAYETQVVQSLGVRIGPPAPSGGAGPRAPALAGACGAGRQLPVPAMIPAMDGAPTPRRRRADPVRWTPPRKRGSRTFPSSSAPWRGPASRDSPGRAGPSKWTRRSSTRPATSSACDLASWKPI